MSRNQKKFWGVFLLGLFSQTQLRLIGALGISELVMFLLAPMFFFKYQNLLKRDGVMQFLGLALLWLLGAVFADFKAHSNMILALKGWAVPIVVMCNMIVLYPLIRKDTNAFKWFVVGSMLSAILSTFVFQAGSIEGVATNTGQSATEAAMGYKLFWVKRVSAAVSLPIRVWYQSCPTLYTLGATLFIAAFALISGGRSSFLCVMVSFLFFAFGGTTVKKMRRISKNIVAMFFLLLLCGAVAKGVYSYAVKHGWMGETELRKYSSQTKSGNSPLKLLMAGRTEFFVAIYAACEKPILGYGSHPPDREGIYIDFVAKYGDESDYRTLCKNLQDKLIEIPAHSHIAAFWLWHGIFGLIFWGYVVYLFSVTLIKRMHVVPEYFGMLAFGIPGSLWAIFFSPFGGRVGTCFMCCICIIIRQRQKEMTKWLRR